MLAVILYNKVCYAAPFLCSQLSLRIKEFCRKTTSSKVFVGKKLQISVPRISILDHDHTNTTHFLDVKFPLIIKSTSNGRGTIVEEIVVQLPVSLAKFQII